ncbi:related to Translation termination inhibitor protein ITT1 [Nakaseomyces glabratus]|nr:IBR domain, a half RING-finger domain [Nakaseomyces glabratus]QNG16618.1 uncharacterized protein GWK60_L15301 [Nakaseomyces glabratus]SCV13959.1 related to Translation termination inhibitor protein ITT1 [Nakaseomyces glabratus]SLM12360.1 related to Translation termination inhibitor protein ITT1 [Nakaseomyces glabratus]
MNDGLNLTDDLQVLCDMYPELTLNEHTDLNNGKTAELVSGALDFNINFQESLKVIFEDYQLTLEGLTSNKLLFTVDPQGYPSLRTGVTLEISSQWMTEDDIMKIMDALDKEFGDMTDPTTDIFDAYTPILMLVFTFLQEDTASILFPDNVKNCLSKDEYSIFESMKEDFERIQHNSNNFDCCICMETKKGRHMVELPCKNTDSKHYLCKDCLKSYYSTLIEEGSIENIRCPECPYKPINLEKYTDYKKMKQSLFMPQIPFEFFQNILSDELCQRYKDLFYTQAATKLSSHCPFACKICPRCDYWCIKEDLDDSLIQCSKCSFAFCFICSHSWHGYTNPCGKAEKIANEIIEEYMEDSTTRTRKKELETKYGKKRLQSECEEYLADKMLDLAIEEKGSNLQRCPSCRLVIERSEGCNKMRCAVCHTLFCFICGSILDPDDPYSHFREIIYPCYGRLFEGMPGT